MSRIAHPSEKVMAVASIVRSLTEELGLDPTPVMVTMTARDVGKDELRLAYDNKPEITWIIPPEVMAALIDAGVRIAMGTDTRDMGVMAEPPKDGQDIANLCDDCGMPAGAHDYEVEH